jgi:hypothetical protein
VFGLFLPESIIQFLSCQNYHGMKVMVVSTFKLTAWHLLMGVSFKYLTRTLESRKTDFRIQILTCGLIFVIIQTMLLRDSLQICIQNYSFLEPVIIGTVMEYWTSQRSHSIFSRLICGKSVQFKGGLRAFRTIPVSKVFLLWE